MNFQQALLKSTVSHGPLEIILMCWCDAQETFIISSIEHGCGA